MKSCSQPTFLAFVREHKKRYGTTAFVSSEYRKRIADIADSACKEFKLGRRYKDEGESETTHPVKLQPWLPF